MNSPYLSRSCMALLLLGGPAWAEVQVRLSQESLTQYQPFQVSFEARGAGLAPPDLTPLGQDFDILDRNVSHSTRNINGQMSQETRLNLILRPKRGGALEIPAIRFGAEQSQPQRIQVAQGSAASGGGTFPGPGYPGPFPDTGGINTFTPVPQGYSPSHNYSFGAGPGSSQEEGGMPVMPHWGAGYGMPPWRVPSAIPDGAPWPGNPPTGPLSTPIPAAPMVAQWPYWPWVAAIAGLGWLLTGLALWRVSGGPPLLIRLPKRSPRPAPARAPAPQDPPEMALAAVRQAYLNNDPFAAREALLHWASQMWPQDPPSNLSRLAVRCPPQAQRHLLKLDEALYSPKPIPWNDASVAEQLAVMAHATSAAPVLS